MNKILVQRYALILFLIFSACLSYSETADDVKRELFGNRHGHGDSARNYNDPDGVMQRIQNGETASSVINQDDPNNVDNLDSLALPESGTLASSLATGDSSSASAEDAKQSKAAAASIGEAMTKEMSYDAFDRLVQVKVGNKVYKYSYDYRGRRIVVDETGAGGKYITINYSGGSAVSESEADYPGGPSVIKRLYYRGPDMGGGVGGINYTTDGNGNNPIYYHYNLRGDVIMKTDKNNNVVFAATYEAFGKCTILVANTNDGTRQRANTKEEDPTGFLNEGHRYRNLGTGTFLTPDPLEYVDGLNQYIYVGQNPWGRFDPLGLAFEHPAQQFGMSVAQFNMMTDALQNCAKTGDPFPTPPKTEPILEVMAEGAIKGYAAGMLGITGFLAAPVVASEAAAFVSEYAAAAALNLTVKALQTASTVTPEAVAAQVGTAMVGVAGVANAIEGAISGEVHNPEPSITDIAAPLALAGMGVSADIAVDAGSVFNAATRGVGVGVRKIAEGINDFIKGRLPEVGTSGNPSPLKPESTPEQPESKSPERDK